MLPLQALPGGRCKVRACFDCLNISGLQQTVPICDSTVAKRKRPNGRCATRKQGILAQGLGSIQNAGRKACKSMIMPIHLACQMNPSILSWKINVVLRCPTHIINNYERSSVLIRELIVKTCENISHLQLYQMLTVVSVSLQHLFKPLDKSSF